MIKKIAPIFFIATAMLIIIISPAKYITSAQEGLLLFVINVLPALFPFFFFSKLLIVYDADIYMGKLLAKPMIKSYKLPGFTGYIMVMSLLCGYPIGAKLTSDYYEEGMLSQKDAKTIASMASTGGPIFIIGTIGALILKNQKAAFLILFAHVLSAFINGFIYSNNSKENNYNINKNKTTLSDCIYSSVSSVLIVGGYIVIFNIICDMLINTNIVNLFSKIIPIDKSMSQGIILSIVELTRGAFEIAKSTYGINIKTAAITGAVTFGGISIIIQSYTFLQKVGIKFYELILYKITHCIFAVAIAFTISLFVF